MRATPCLRNGSSCLGRCGPNESARFGALVFVIPHSTCCLQPTATSTTTTCATRGTLTRSKRLQQDTGFDAATQCLDKRILIVSA